MIAVSCTWNGLRLTGGYDYEEPSGFHGGPGGLEVELDWTFGVEDGEELARCLEGDWGGTVEEDAALTMTARAKQYGDLPAEVVEWIHKHWWEWAYDELVAAARVAMRAPVGDYESERD